MLPRKNIASLFLTAMLLAALWSGAIAQEPESQQEAVPQTATASVLKQVTHEKIAIADQIVVMIKIEGPFLIETFELIGPRRLVIDFKQVSLIEAPPIIEINDLGVLNIRTGQFQPTVARVVFDLDSRLPSHSIATLPDGVKVVFWQEVLPEPQPETVPPEAPVLKPAAPRAAAVPEITRPPFFIRFGPAMTLFLKPAFAVTTDFDLYGETATMTETLTQQIQPGLEISFGKMINPKFRAGLSASYQFLNAKPTLEASLPHPFLYDTYREVSFDADTLTSNMWIVSESETEPRQATRLTSSMITISAWGLYSLYQTDKLDISAGPILGFSFGTLYSLDDFELSEESPYEAQNVSVTSTTFLENKFFKIDPGFLLSGAYFLNDKLSAFASLKVQYVDVMVEALERRASLFRLSLQLGLEYGF